MRTYTRKRIKHTEIKDIHNLCRLCLNKPNNGVTIYKDNKNNICAALALRIMICVGLEVSWDDCLPNIVCSECCKELERYYAFRKRCEATYRRLKSHIQAVRQNGDKHGEHPSATNNEDVTTENDNEDVDLFMWPSKDDKLEVVETEIDNLLNRDEVLSSDVKVQESVTEVEPNIEKTVEPNFEAFLSTVLLQLGVVAPLNNKLTLLDPNVRTLEVETANGKYLVELMEEDPQMNNNKNVDESNLMNQSVMKENHLIDVAAAAGADGSAGAAAGAAAVGGADGLSCGACGKRFATRSLLARHHRVHSGERPHACRVCARRFSQRSVMQRHELVHKVQRPHQCAQCPKSFTQRGALEAHARTHAPPHQRALSLHRCPRCPKLFLYASGLSRHMRAHEGRVYECGPCARHFRDKSSLLRHLRSARHHAA